MFPLRLFYSQLSVFTVPIKCLTGGGSLLWILIAVISIEIKTLKNTKIIKKYYEKRIFLITLLKRRPYENVELDEMW